MELKGLAALTARLQGMAARAKKTDVVSIGFFEGATYPNGQSVPTVAAIQEFGAIINIPARTATIYRSIDKNGRFNKQGRFVKRAKSNFASDHAVAGHSVTIPSRPYFRGMVARDSPTWGASMAVILDGNGYDADKTLGAMGLIIEGQLRASIIALVAPPLAASTIARRLARYSGKSRKPPASTIAKPLIDTGLMLSRVASEVGAP